MAPTLQEVKSKYTRADLDALEDEAKKAWLEVLTERERVDLSRALGDGDDKAVHDNAGSFASKNSIFISLHRLPLFFVDFYVDRRFTSKKSVELRQKRHAASLRSVLYVMHVRVSCESVLFVRSEVVIG